MIAAGRLTVAAKFRETGMARLVGSVLLATAFAFWSVGAMAADDPAMQCDNLAGSPEDLDLPKDASGISFADLDPTDAVEQACLAAAKADPTARRFLAHLGRLYAKRGQSIRALEAYRLAHGRGSAIAANNLGAMYTRGEGVVQSDERATQYFRKAAHRGLPYAMLTMASRARVGRGMPENERMSFFWYERAHKAGNVTATNDLGVMYQGGYGVRENDARAVELFAEALRDDPGYALAAYNLAGAYEAGEGVPVDYVWARGYYAVAFDAGDADAADDLGRMSAEGLGSPPDPAVAADWYRRGAEDGSMFATVNFADALAEGVGVEPDAAKARSLYTAALDLDPSDEWRAYIEDQLKILPEEGAADPAEATE